MKPKKYLVGLVLVLISSSARLAVGEDAKLLFYAPFDGSAQAKIARGEAQPLKASGISFVPGVQGQAALVDEKDRLAYSSAGNLTKDRGSFAFWIKPNWDFRERISRALFLEDSPSYEVGSLCLRLWRIGYKSGNSLCFDIRERTGNYMHYPIDDWWEKGEWYQVVGTWDRKIGMRLYLDGGLTMCRNFTWEPRNYQAFYLGSPAPAHTYFGMTTADAALDEFRIYDRALTPGEIKDLYNSTRPQAKPARTTKPLQEIVPWMKISQEPEGICDGEPSLDIFPDEAIFDLGQAERIEVILCNREGEDQAGAVKYRLQAPSGKMQEGIQQGLVLKANGTASFSIPFRAREAGEYVLSCSWEGKNSFGSISHLLVMEPVRAERPGHSERLKLKLIDRVDCATETSADRFCDDGTSRIVDSPVGRYRESGEKGFSMFAYRFRIKQPHAPHLVVITYPDDQARTFEIVKTAPHWTVPMDVQTGVITGDEYPNTNHMQQHRFILWPREKDLAFLFISWEKGRPAAAGKIEIYQVQGGLPPARVNSPQTGPERLIGLYQEDSAVLRSAFGGLDNSLTEFHRTLTNLIDYLKFTGQNLVAYPMVHYNGIFYPSRVEGRGSAWVGGSYPEGFWELALKMFSRNRLYLIPEFMMFYGLPSMKQVGATDEEQIRAGEETILRVSSEGKVQAGRYPHYNPIHPIVQTKMLAVVDEILERYGDYPAFRGLSFSLAQVDPIWFASLEYGYGDYNAALFQKETGIKMPVDDKEPQRFAKRYRWIMDNAKEPWVQWRCRKIYGLFAQISQRLANKRPDLRLVLSCWVPYGYGGPPPSGLGGWKPNGKPVFQIYREAGIDLNLYQGKSNIHIEKHLYPCCYRWRRGREAFSPTQLLSRDINFDSQALGTFANGIQTSACFFNRYFENAFHPNWRRSKDIRSQMPGFWWGDSSWTWPSVTPGHKYFLEVYAHALATFDAGTIINGGGSIGTVGHGEQVKEFAQAFRALPAQPFTQLKGLTDPVQGRELRTEAKYYFYLVNREHYPVQVNLTFAAQPGFRLLNLAADQQMRPTRQGDGYQLSLTVEPYQLLSFAATPASVKIVSSEVMVPAEEVARLRDKVAKVEVAMTTLRERNLPSEEYQARVAELQTAWAEKRYSAVHHLVESYEIAKLFEATKPPRMEPMLWWKFDEGEGAVAGDSGGNSNVAEIQGATWVAGKSGQALHFDGRDDYLEIDHPQLGIDDKLTYSLWAKFDVLGTAQEIIRQGNKHFGSASANDLFEFCVDAEEGYLTISTQIPDTDWHHWMGTYDGATMKLYLDGELKATKSQTGSVRGAGSSIVVGKNPGLNARFFQGTLDEMKIYNRALTPEDVRKAAGR